MLPVDAPNRGVEAKAVDVGAAKRLPVVVVAEGAPTEPARTEPAPTEPAPTEPAPTEPAPTEPAPTEPAPTEPVPTEPAPTEPAPILTVPRATPKGLAVVGTLLNRPPALAAEVEESLKDGLVMAVVVVVGGREVNWEPPAGAGTLVEAEMMLGKNGLAAFVAEKADAVPADKPSGLAATVVVEEVVVLDLAPLRVRSNKPAGGNAGVVAAAPKMLPGTGSVLVAAVDDTILDLLLSDKTWAKMPPALVDIGKPDGVTLVSLFSDGVPLEGRET